MFKKTLRFLAWVMRHWLDIPGLGTQEKLQVEGRRKAELRFRFVIFGESV